MKFFFFKIISYLQRNRKIKYSKSLFYDEVYLLFCYNLGLGDFIMLSPILNHLKKQENIKSLTVVTHLPNIFIEKVKYVTFIKFFIKIIFSKKKILIISPSVNFFHGLSFFFNKPMIGYFGSNDFFSNIKDFRIKYRFDGVNDHYNKRLIPFFKLFNSKNKINNFNYCHVQERKPKIRNIRQSIFVSPYKLNQSMRWDKNNFIKILYYLKKKFKHNIIYIIGGIDKDNILYNREISLKTGAVDLTGKLNILELNYIIKNCLLFIGLDNFLSHLSYASKKPSIIIFGSTSPKLRAPKITKKTFFLNSNKNICKHFPCFNSVDYKGCVNNIEYKCIKSIKVSSLENLINKLDL